MANAQHGMTGQQNAKKGSTADQIVRFRAHGDDKAAWVEAAGGNGKLSAWATKTLNDAVGRKTTK